MKGHLWTDPGDITVTRINYFMCIFLSFGFSDVSFIHLLHRTESVFKDEETLLSPQRMLTDMLLKLTNIPVVYEDNKNHNKNYFFNGN